MVKMRIMNKINIVFFLLLWSILLISCENDNPIDREQYFKQVYIVGADKKVQAFDVTYGDGPQSAYLSLATGGSLNIDRDVKVTVGHYDEAIDWYNNKYMIDEYIKYQKMNEYTYDIPSYSAIIKSGNVYERLPFYVYTKDLNCDSLYALTFRIEEVSDFVKNEQDTVLIMNINLINDFSGVYQMTATQYTIDNLGEETAPTTIIASRELKATDEHTVRFFNAATNQSKSGYETKEEYFNSINKNCITFKHLGENTFSVHGWKELNIIDGTAKYSYDEILNSSTIVFSYDYIMEDGTIIRIKGFMKK